MFGFGKKAADPPARGNRGRPSAEGREKSKVARPDLSFLGIGDDNFDALDVGDDDLENELLALMNEGSKSNAGRKSRTAPPINPILAKPIPSVQEISKLGESDAEDDDDISESELEAELSEITQDEPPPVPPRSAVSAPVPPPPEVTVSLVPLLQERLQMYETVKSAAEAAGDTSKVRRFTRAMKTLQDLLKSAKAGKLIDENDIPPVVALPTKKAAPSEELSSNATEPEPVLLVSVDPVPSVAADPQIPDLTKPDPLVSVAPKSSEMVNAEPNDEVQQHLMNLKKVAVVLKRNGDVAEGLKYLKLAKALESEIRSGHTVDLSLYPLPAEASSEPSVAPTAEPVPPVTEPVNMPQEAAATEPPATADVPETPKTIMEALQQRLEKYKSELDKANESNNSAKARRLGRIVKQYEEAISLHKKNKPVPFEDLPTPPGFPPIPVPQSASAAPVTPSAPSVSVPDAGVPASEPIRPSPSKVSPPAASEKSPVSAGGVVRNPQKPAAAKLTLQEKQLQTLLNKQKHFKEAALEAKKRGDLSQAKEFLRQAKGFDSLIQASKCGLPVDMATLPSDPEVVAAMEAEDYEVVGGDDCIVPEGDIAEVYSKLEEDLKNQLKTCMRNREHFKNIGDIASANRFERLALESKRDLDTLRLAAKQGSSLPTYRYENRIFTITECNTDLQEDEMELELLRGINFKVPNPNEIDTFVKIEMPYPTAEEPQRYKTEVIYNTNNPEFNAKFKMPINKKERKFQRFIHNKGIKLELWSKGGFLRSNTLLGTGAVKLLGLETKCTVHDGVDVMDGKKNIGKLEVKVRLRDPVLAKQITQKKEKWLSIEKL